ncbi:uncharacterized protein LOC124606105 [Schistocerca americana]|uniref:uncharacterized protein LOC124606105 n=1 Tax=Schistocerca americana TaxID=7009 RepID=UPI001F4F55E6|nr:uncharacterized protein LOC124606105 [Schistocerca americana]
MAAGADSSSKRTAGAAPEGGWGWAVAAGLAATLIVALGPQMCFGLIFGDFLESLGEGTRGVTLITSVNMALHSFTGLLANYALKTYSCRQVALTGATLFFVGNLLTVFANSVFYMIITFAILPGVGLGLMLPASYTSFNTYFSERRVPVMGATQTVLSAGVMVYPLLVERLAAWRGFRAAQAAVAGLSLLAVAGALAYLPLASAPSSALPACCRRRRASLGDAAAGDDDRELQSPVSDVKLCGDLLSEGGKVSDQQLVANGKLVAEQLSGKHHPAPRQEDRENSRRLLLDPGRGADGDSDGDDDVDAPTDQVAEDAEAAAGDRGARLRRTASQVSVVSVGALAVMVPTADASGHPRSPRRFSCRRLWRSVHDFLDLGLLRDPVYTNLNLGVSLAFYSDFTFSTLLPLFLASAAGQGQALGARGAAACLTVGAACDVLGRVAFSLQGACPRYRLSSRAVFLIGSACIVIARTGMIYVSGFTMLAVITGVLGFFRSWIHITFSLVFAEYCSIERFPSAYGLYMAVSGIIGMSTGPLIGLIRDVTDSYPICIHALNLQMMLCVIPWTLELIITALRKKKPVAEEETKS